MSDPQSLDHPPLHEMLFDDRIDIGDGAASVPDALGIDHHGRPLFATLHAARLIDPNPTRPAQIQLGDSLLGVCPQWFGTAPPTTGTRRLGRTGIGTKENVIAIKAQTASRIVPARIFPERSF